MSLSRRSLLKAAAFTAAAPWVPKVLLANPVAAQSGIPNFTGEKPFEELLHTALSEEWTKLPFGEIIAKAGLFFVGTPYVGHTLDTDTGEEACTINLNGLDCVTLFENALDFARMLVLGGRTPEAMLAQVHLTRYRHGVVNGFPSRLHYTTDWVFDNVAKHVVKNMTPHLPGAIQTDQKVGIMSHRPELYRQLQSNPDLIIDIKRDEDAINKRRHFIVPMDKVKEAEAHLQSGDIVGVATDESGIDIAHTGLIVRTPDGTVHFLDASSKPGVMRVTLEGELDKSIRWSTHNTGIIIARPISPLSK